MDRRAVAGQVANFQTAQPRARSGVITRSHFTRIADAHGVDAKTVERDYVLAHSVAAINRHPAEHGLVFKGGTALRLCYFEDYRYSADLDFSLRQGSDLDTTLRCIQAALDDAAS
jgi:predicted nucleotidyltransferase component of viral defense system